jgi:hypothetical protein
MNGWNDFIMKQEQYRDQSREAARQRLIKSVADSSQGPGSSPKRGNLVLRITNQRASRRRAACCESNCLVEKAA